MTKFTKRTTAPSTSNAYYYSSNIFYKCGYGMPNCTAYAWGRFYELMDEYPKLCTANAENWYKFNDGYKRGKTPKLGAIIVWSRGVIGESNDGAGHVAIVEEIYSDGAIRTSNSAWGGTNFYMQTLKPPYALGGTYKFEGFIYCPIEWDNEVDVKPTETPKDLSKYTDVQLATLVWKDAFGSGATREQKLGDRYKAVQALVEEYVGQDPKSDITSKALAKEVWDDLWGTGQARFDALDNFGYDSDKVQYWVNETAPNAPAPKPTPTKSITVGSKVVVTNPVDWNGTSLAVSGAYDVIEVSGNRVVIGKGSAVTAAIHKDNLKLV